MDDSLFDKILSNVRAHTEFLETINLYGINEPTLDSRLLQRVETIRKVFGAKQLVRIVSNGARVTEELCTGLLKLKNVNLYVDVYSDTISKKISKLRGEGFEIDVWDKRLTIEYENQLVLHKKDCRPYRIKKPLSMGICALPHHAIFVRYDGRMDLCCADVASLTTYNNANNSKNLVESWSEATHNIGVDLLIGKRTGHCTECSRSGSCYW
jgi:hypothetical protein